MKIAIRIDDMTPDMDWDNFYRFKEILDKNGIKPLIGVVPDNLDENLQVGEYHSEFFREMRQLQNEGWCIALHGYQHQYSTKKSGIFPLNNFSEFAGVSYDKQFDMLLMGKTILESKGIETDIFMAPGHTLDKNTLKALSKLGFQYVTDGFGTEPYIRNGITFLPIAYRKNKNFHDKTGYTTFVYHLNNTKDEQFEKFAKLLERKKKYFISYQEYLDVDGKKRGNLGNMKEYVMAKLKFMLVRIRNRK